ncbi:hypothetical protein BH09VER1_BH09VER1_34240 [soil metagenome]
MNTPRLLVPLLLATWWLGSLPLRSESDTTQEIADRYEQLLVRSPQGGPSFDRVVDWYATKGGGLEALQKRWKDAAHADSTNRESYLILEGLLAERLRSPAEARAFYLEALKLPGDQTQPAKLLATLETTEGNFKAAAEAYNQALAPDTLDPVARMEIMRSLALLYQRSFDDEKALAVWRDAVKRFPADPYVLEEAGEAFLAANDYAEARQTFTTLRDISTRDAFRRVSASLRLARTAELEGKNDEAVQIYELALAETSEGSWLNREVRARIEELFRRKDDLPGLLAYYQKRMADSPQDFQSLAAQAGVLEDLGRADEAADALRAASKLAPQNIELRLALIRSLTGHGKITDALAEATELCQAADASPEALVMLGNLHWALFIQSKNAQDRANAITAWQRIAPADSRDTARVAQLAEILASHDQTDEAIAQWQRIVALTPDASDARQRLAEVYLKRGDKTAAAAILDGLVSADRAQAENYLALARIQERMEMTDAARATTRKGLELFPKDYELLGFAWRQATEAKDGETVTRLFPSIWLNAPNEFFAEDAVKKYASFLETIGTDKDTSKALSERLEKGPLEPAETIVLFRLSLSQQNEETARKALDLLKTQNTPVRAARAAFDFASTFGSPDEQVAALQAVAAADPRMASDSLRSAARIQAEAGQVDAALKTLSQLIERSPADASLYTQYADVATRSGKIDDAVRRLRDAVRYVEDTSTLSLQLASLLEVQGLTAEASKVLQDAFEKEQRDGRRMEIFRRQIENAMQSGGIDGLIASLREKQAREQGGGRYGTYLAEIFMLQGDFIAAREELTRSLGKTPDNPTAVSRLIDLADRGGDQEESLRLSAKLAELEPSRENRAAYISKLFAAGELERGQAEFERARAEILKDPTGWSGVLNAMRKIGLDQQCDAVIEELATASDSGILPRAELARLRLMQRNYDAAQKTLWQVLEAGDFSVSLAAVAADIPAISQPGLPKFYLQMQPFQILANEVQNSLQQLFTRYRGNYFSSSMRMGAGLNAGAAKVTPEQREQIRSLFLLAQLADAMHEEEPFFERLRKFLAERDVPRSLRLIVLRFVNDANGVNDLIRQQADDEKGELETDRLIVANGIVSDPAMADVIKKITERIGRADPTAGFEQALSKTSAEFASKRNGPSPIDPKTREALRAQVDILLKHPGLAQSQFGKAQVAMLAATAGDFSLAFRLSREAAAEAKDPKQAATKANPNLNAQIRAMSAGLVALAIADHDSTAPAAFEELLKSPPKAGGLPSVYFGSYGMGLGRSMNQLLQPSPDLVAGDITFPVSLFRQISPFPAQSPQAERVQKWFSERATAQELNPYTIGAFYADWFGGKRDAAVKRLEAIHEKHPSQRTAALLFEAYEKLNQPAKALAVIDAAGLQDNETMDIRALRRIRLLRATGQIDDARTAAERLARGRVSFAIRDQLANELNLLGVPSTKYQNLAAGSLNRTRQNRDKTAQIREQINKLIADKKIDEAERIALQILQHPLPSRQDYMESNARQNMVSLLKSMGRLDRLQANLEDRLAKDPENLDLAVRLAEVQSLDEGRNFADRLADFITTHPSQSNGIDYAIQLLQRRGNGEKTIARILCALIQANPDFLASTGMQANELMNFTSDPAAGVLLANTIAGLKDEDYRKLFLPARLSRDMSEAAFLGQLAEFSAQAGQTDQAIALLKRNRAEAAQNLDAGLPSILRLAELQLAQGKKEEAAQTMKDLFDSKQSVGAFMGGGNRNLTFAFSNLLMNQQRQGGDIILRTARLAEQSGTLDILLASLDAQGKQFPIGISPSLLIRTFLKRPEISKEWRAIALSDDQLSGYMTLPMLSTVVNALAAQPDANKLIPAILRKISESQYGMGGDYALTCLADTLPALAKYQADPAVKKHISLLVTKAMADPNGSRYLIFSESYTRSINTLIQFGYLEEARKLFDFTAGERASQNFGNRSEMQNLEARLSAAEGNGASIDIVCAAMPIGPDRLRIQWKAGLDIDTPTEDSSASTASWDDTSVPLPKSLRPLDLEIFAGPNPGALDKVAQQPKPELSGTIEAKVTAPIGLLQARWKMPDGTRKSGPLTAYVLGENLVVNRGIPDSKTPGTADPFKTGQPGPTGKDSAIRYETSAATQRARVDLASIVLDEKSPEIIVFSGWIQAGGRGGNMPRLETTVTQDGGKSDTNTNYIPQTVPGQWRQSIRLWSMGTSFPDAQSLPKSAGKMDFRIALDASSGYYSQWLISGAWDGLQIVRLKPADDSESSRKMLNAYRTAANKKDFAAAATAFLIALRTNPYEALQQSPTTIVEVFKKSNRLGDLFTQVSAPALLLANPLRNNRPVLQNEALIDLLAREALAPGAPPEAHAWISLVENAPLNENLRFILQAAALREEASRDPSKVGAKEVMALLGFKPNGLNRERVRSLWSIQRSGKPTISLLNLLNDEQKTTEARALLKPIQIPVEMLASRQMLEAWLLAPTDPQGALDLWNQTVSQRYGGQNSVSFDEEADRALILRIAQKYPTPGNLVAALNGWLAKRNPNDEYQRRLVVEILYAAAKSDSVHRDEYAALWADAELAALKTPGYNPSRDRIRELAKRLMENSEWDRLNNLLTVSKASTSLGNDPIQREFAQLRDLVAFGQGNLDVAWPVCWCKPGTDSREVEVTWQWNTKDIVPSEGKFDTSVSVADKPILPEIKGQKSVELFFGELPSTMQSIGKVEGPAATGSLKVTLPSSNGFLRTVANFEDQKVSGPLTPVLSGKRVYPPSGTSLKTFLSMGSQPISPTLLTDSGTAPDGSPAVRIGTPREGRQLGLTGNDIPVVPGKFYVSRGWMRHIGNGSAVVSSEYKPVKTSTKGSLNMLLSDKPEAAGQWVLYTRAMPALSQHTFWIPFKDVDTVTPRIWDAQPGTELAAWELIEVEGWKYSDWITDLAHLRDSAGDTPDAATLDKAIALASIEPLTSLDYHGDWLGAQLPKAGKGDQLLALYQTAFSAEANPLFSRPKYWRLFNNITTALNAGEGSPEFRWQLAQIALANKDRSSPVQRLGFQNRALAVAPSAEKKVELGKSAREELTPKISDPAFLKTVTSANTFRDDRPVSELLTLLLALNDAETTKLVLQQLKGKGGDGVEFSDKLFATIALEAVLPDAKADEKWNEQVDRAFRATENATNPDAYLRWPAALADLLTAKKLAPDTVMHIRKAALERVLKAKDEERGKLAESIHSAVFLIETSLAQGDTATANETAATILPVIQANSGKLSEESLRTILRAVKILPKEQADALVSAADADIKKSPKMSAAYGNR